MLYVAVSDGRTFRIDLGSESDLSLLKSFSGPGEVRSIALSVGGHRADLPLPRRFHSVEFEAEVVRDADGEAVAERVAAVCDGVYLSLTMSTNGQLGRFRIDLDKRGRRRFAPRS